jgi:DNA topoisomerase-2
MDISEFFMNERIGHASYDNVRKICQIASGLKLSQTKIIWTMLQDNISKDFKVASLASRVAEKTEYLHGSVSLENAIVNMARDYAGANNIPLITRSGIFGDVTNNSAGASRYIFTALEKHTPYIFRKEDNLVLEEQIFEGTKIEPKFLYPIIPLWAINGAKGISSGFAQNILPRNPKDIIEYLECKLSGKSTKKLELLPWFNGFRGEVVRDTEKPNAYIIKGICEKLNATTVKITELPIGYELNSYKKKLDKLEDEGKIVGYNDFTDNGIFCFEVKFTRTGLANIKDLNDFLKLNVRVTENLVFISTEYRAEEYNNIETALGRYIDIRIAKYNERKIAMLKEIKKDLNFNKNKLKFVKYIIEDKIIINKKSKQDIKSQLEEFKFNEVDGSYNYLLNMPIYSLGHEKLKELVGKINELTNKYKKLDSSKPEDIWLDDLSELKNKI